jgi:hypothetical protein
MDPSAVVSLQGPVTTSEQKTKALSQSSNPFWNEKFVFGVEEQHVTSTMIHAQIISKGKPVAHIASVSVASLLKGQKMSLPTINNGADIYCVDGWFDPSPLATFSALPQTPNSTILHLRIPQSPPLDPQTPIPELGPSSMSPKP